MVATDVNGCEVEAVIFDVVAGTEDPGTAMFSTEGLIVFPNPVTEKLSVSVKQPAGTAVQPGVFVLDGVSIYNLLGESIEVHPGQNHITSMTLEFDVHTFAKGMYWLELHSGDRVFRIKFIKE